MCIRVAIKVAYFNTIDRLHGFQIQPDVETIQGLLIQAIKKTGYVDTVNFKLDYAGRTDNGVNALCQVVAFNLSETLTEIPSRFLYQINNFLPKNVRCWAYTSVLNSFKPRFNKQDVIFFRVL